VDGPGGRRVLRAVVVEGAQRLAAVVEEVFDLVGVE